METNLRVLAKAICWQSVGLITMTVLGFLFTGSISSGSALAVSSGVVGLAAYVIHEKAWSCIQWGKNYHIR